MASTGESDPLPVAGCFADTKWEPESVVRWLQFLCGCDIKEISPGQWVTIPGVYQKGVLSFPVHCVSKGDLAAMALNIRSKRDGSGNWAKTVIPTFIRNKDGSRGKVQRQCTYDYKLAQIIKCQREIIGKHAMKSWRQRHRLALTALFEWEVDCASKRKLKRPAPIRPQWAWEECQTDALVVARIGISLDEAVFRCKESTVYWSKNAWPLVTKKMSRWDCLRWMEQHGYPKPPRSACIFCPYHDDNEWRRMKSESPNDFLKAVQFEKQLQAVKATTDNMNGVPFLHDSLKPLDEVDLSTEEERGQLNLFNNECEGMCGV